MYVYEKYTQTKKKLIFLYFAHLYIKYRIRVLSHIFISRAYIFEGCLGFFNLFLANHLELYHTLTAEYTHFTTNFKALINYWIVIMCTWNMFRIIRADSWILSFCSFREMYVNLILPILVPFVALSYVHIKAEQEKFDWIL